MAPLDNCNEIKRIRTYVEAAESEINGLKIIPRIQTRYAFDSVALSTVSKAFALSKACLALLDSSFPDEAYGLSRSLVECSTNLRFLTENPALLCQRTHDFIKYFLANKSFWLYYALQQFAGKKEEQEIRNYARQLGVNPNVKPARRHWSGRNGFVWEITSGNHPLDGSVTAENRNASYAIDYYATSIFVHCSQGAVDNYFPEEQTPFCVSPSSRKYDQLSWKTLLVILVYLHSSIAYALYGLNLERPGKLNTLFQETLKQHAAAQIKSRRSTIRGKKQP